MYMYKIVNKAGRWERFCRSVYQKVDLSIEAKNARKRCKQNLETIKGGLRGSKELFHSQVLSFWSKYNIKPDKMWYDLYCFKMKSTTQRYIPEDLYWQKFIPYLTDPAFDMHIPINVLITSCFLI